MADPERRKNKERNLLFLYMIRVSVHTRIKQLRTAAAKWQALKYHAHATSYLAMTLIGIM